MVLGGLLAPGISHAQSLSGADFSPARATRNSIFHYGVTWSWPDVNRFPYAAQRYQLHGPEEVIVGVLSDRNPQIAGPAGVIIGLPGSNQVIIPLNAEDTLVGVAGVWDNPERRGTNYYREGEGGAGFTGLGLVTLSENLPNPLPQGGVWVNFITLENNIVQFRLPNTIRGADVHHEVFSAAGYDYQPNLINPEIPLSGNCGNELAPLDQQPGGRLINQATAANAQGWRTLRLPNPTGRCEGELWRFNPTAAAGGDNGVVFSDPEGNIITAILGVYDNPAGTGTNYYTNGSFDPVTGQINFGTVLPDTLPNDPNIWVHYVIEDPAPFVFDITNPVVDVRVAGFRVVEDDIEVDPYGDGTTLFTRAGPVAAVTGVFDEFGNNYYLPGGSLTLGGPQYNQSRINLGRTLPPTVKRVKIIYWLAPVRLQGPGGAFAYDDELPDGTSVSYSVPLVAGLEPGTDPPDPGSRYIVSGSAGLQLAENPRGVPGLRYLSSPGSGGDDPPIHQWVATHVEYGDGGAQRIDNVNDPTVHGRLRTASKDLEYEGPFAYGSRIGDPSVVEQVGPTTREFITVVPPGNTNISGVAGVWDNAELKGTNYYTGGSFNAAANVIQLGTQLPSTEQPVWVLYTYDGLMKWGGGGSIDTLINMRSPSRPAGPDPRNFDPLIVEQYKTDIKDPSDPTGNTVLRAFIYYDDDRLFIPFNPDGQPDSGNSSNTITFRTRYYNFRDLPPSSWHQLTYGLEARAAQYMWNYPQAGAAGPKVYIRYDGQDDFQVHSMTWENPAFQTYSADEGVGYTLRFEPNMGLSGWTTNDDARTAPRNISNPNNYIAMPVGQHEYFFAATDDILLDRDGQVYRNPLAEFEDLNLNRPASGAWDISIREPLDQNFDAPTWLEMNPPYYRRGNLYRVGTGTVTNPIWVDPYAFVDRTTMRPGVSETITVGGQQVVINQGYPFSSLQHPVIHGLLSGIPFGPDATGHIGSGRFLGTLQPFRRYVNPTFQFQPTGPNDGSGLGAPGTQLIETAGGTSSTVFTFRVVYQSIDPVTKEGRAPNYVRLFINNTADATGAYQSFTMSPVKSNPTEEDYRTGLIYQRQIGNLAPGPHTYYFEADAGFGPIRFPVRPDGRRHEAPVPLPDEDPLPVPAWRVDPWVPGEAPFADNNDYIPGPYINSAPVLSNHSVTPASGPLGTEFVYTVTYSDADNQRPSMAKLIIDRGPSLPQLVVDMQRVNPGATNFVAGVQYRYRLSTVQASTLPLGQLRYRFEFADDWGRRTDLNDVLPGELVNYPAGSEGLVNWFEGPLVGELSKPELLAGSVTSLDGSATPSTVWDYSVTYRHETNIAPSYVRVYIGWRRAANDPNNIRTLQRLTPISSNQVLVTPTAAGTPSLPILSVTGVWITPNGSGTNYYTGGSFNANTGVITLGQSLPPTAKDVWVTYAANPITWVDGGTLARRNPADNNFRNGVVYFLQRTLPGPTSTDTFPISYYYSFQASDGNLTARYDAASSPSAFARTRSDVVRAGEILNHATSIGNQVYELQFKPVVGRLPAGAIGDQGVLAEPRVYRNGNLLRRAFTDILDSTDPSALVVINPNRREIRVDPSLVSMVRGIYNNPNRIGTNFYTNNADNTYNRASGMISLAVALPSFSPVYIEYYSEADYRIDFVNGRITFTQPNASSDEIEVEYWWSAFGPTVGQNNPPILSNGRFTPNNPEGVDGTSTTQFTFSVTYTDLDGALGQAPSFIRVIIDDVPFNMTPAPGSGTNYRNGVTFQYTTTLSGGQHFYYFEASDGSAFAAFDADGSKNSTIPITNLRPIVGPLVNDNPILSGGAVTPSGNIPVGTTVTYTVNYRDPDGDAPMVGYPRVWIDNPQELLWEGNITFINGNELTIDGVNWEAGSLVGKMLQITTGLVRDPDSGVQLPVTSASGKVFQVIENSSNTITIGVVDPAVEGVTVGDSISVASLVMTRLDPNQTNFTQPVTYRVVVPSLPVGAHTYHFSVIAPPTTAIVRDPLSGEYSGPNVTATAPAGNVAPVLSAGAVSPSTGTADTTFVFRVSYSDADNDPATAHSGVVGWVKLVFDNPAIPDRVMRPVTPPASWIGPVEHRVDVSDLPAGTHRFHFEANDGYRSAATVARWPAAAAQDPSVSINGKPVLSIGAGQGVSPTTGTPSTLFTWRVTYRDPDNDAPAYVRVVIDGTAYDMDKVGTSTNYIAGVTYAYSRMMPLGSHTYFFTASDGFQTADSTEVFSGPIVQSLVEPELSEGQVSPDSGPADTQFTYTVKYKDVSGLPPAAIAVHIDGEVIGRAMTRDLSYGVDGQGRMLFRSSPITLTDGAHTYHFTASNGQVTTRLPAGSGVFNGPTVTGAGLTLNVTPFPNASLGDQIRVSGTLTAAGVNPATITLQAVRPDGTSVNRTVTTTSAGAYSANLAVADVSGNWTIRATWAGGGGFASQTITRTLTVGGLAMDVTAGVVDMVGLTVIPTSNNPADIFGAAPANRLNIALWNPLQARYLMHPTDTVNLFGGSAFWIRPQITETIVANGRLWPQDTPYNINLYTGWNMVGSVFVEPIDLGRVQVRYQGSTRSLNDAAAANWIRNYAWGYNPSTRQYFLVQPGTSAYQLQFGRGYWIRALVDCELILRP